MCPHVRGFKSDFRLYIIKVISPLQNAFAFKYPLDFAQRSTMAASVAPARCSSRESSHSYYDNSNAEAGPSRHPKALVTDQQTSITALSSSLLRGLDLRTLGRCRGASQDIALVEDDGQEGVEEETPVVVDKKGKKPMRPKKYLCPREDCDKSFSKPAKLREHELSHTGEVSTIHSQSELR
jgi:hypothetical protein